MSANDGGPAFPESASGPYPNGEIVMGRPGMSLRDWFAGQALATMKEPDYSSFERMAEFAYSLADAMLAARERKEDK